MVGVVLGRMFEIFGALRLLIYAHVRENDYRYSFKLACVFSVNFERNNVELAVDGALSRAIRSKLGLPGFCGQVRPSDNF